MMERANHLMCKHYCQPHPGHVTVTLQRSPCTVTIKDAPADVCHNRGEYDLDEETSSALLAPRESRRHKRGRSRNPALRRTIG